VGLASAELNHQEEQASMADAISAYGGPNPAFIAVWLAQILTMDRKTQMFGFNGRDGLPGGPAPSSL